MKVPPKRKGNSPGQYSRRDTQHRLNESPSEKEGKFLHGLVELVNQAHASMKVPPKRKGNGRAFGNSGEAAFRLNESPSEKEGK